MEKDLDLGMVRDIVVGEEGEGELLLLPGGLDPGVLSREWRKLELRVRTGSCSKVGNPVALVVVVQVLVDILRIRLGGKLLRNLCRENGIVYCYQNLHYTSDKFTTYVLQCTKDTTYTRRRQQKYNLMLPVSPACY